MNVIVGELKKPNPDIAVIEPIGGVPGDMAGGGDGSDDSDGSDGEDDDDDDEQSTNYEKSQQSKTKAPKTEQMESTSIIPETKTSVPSSRLIRSVSSLSTGTMISANFGTIVPEPSKIPDPYPDGAWTIGLYQMIEGLLGTNFASTSFHAPTTSTGHKNSGMSMTAMYLETVLPEPIRKPDPYLDSAWTVGLYDMVEKLLGPNFTSTRFTAMTASTNRRTISMLITSAYLETVLPEPTRKPDPYPNKAWELGLFGMVQNVLAAQFGESLSGFLTSSMARKTSSSNTNKSGKSRKESERVETDRSNTGITSSLSQVKRGHTFISHLSSAPTRTTVAKTACKLHTTKVARTSNQEPAGAPIDIVFCTHL
ncbi:hypothetical protein MMC21_008433 [Puttea exsequens]|nr:hypothetical protein [Puttea exsequens]